VELEGFAVPVAGDEVRVSRWGWFIRDGVDGAVDVVSRGKHQGDLTPPVHRDGDVLKMDPSVKRAHSHQIRDGGTPTFAVMHNVMGLETAGVMAARDLAGAVAAIQASNRSVGNDAASTIDATEEPIPPTMAKGCDTIDRHCFPRETVLEEFVNSSIFAAGRRHFRRCTVGMFQHDMLKHAKSPGTANRCRADLVIGVDASSNESRLALFEHCMFGCSNVSVSGGWRSGGF
jgi:hypothetical protein